MPPPEAADLLAVWPAYASALAADPGRLDRAGRASCALASTIRGPICGRASAAPLRLHPVDRPPRFSAALEQPAAVSSLAASVLAPLRARASIPAARKSGRAAWPTDRRC